MHLSFAVVEVYRRLLLIALPLQMQSDSPIYYFTLQVTINSCSSCHCKLKEEFLTVAQIDAKQDDTAKSNKMKDSSLP